MNLHVFRKLKRYSYPPLILLKKDVIFLRVNVVLCFKIIMKIISSTKSITMLEIKTHSMRSLLFYNNLTGDSDVFAVNIFIRP